MKLNFGKYYFFISWRKQKSSITFFNYLEKDIRYFGYKQWYYDGPIYTFGFWFFNVSWIP